MQEHLNKNIKYILSIGRRQPMHIGHKAGLEKILALKDKQLVYVIGSSNLKGDKLFDPIMNPLTIGQQIEQFKVVFPKETPIFIPIIDVPDMGQWGDIMIDALAKEGIAPEECMIHFIGKDEDRLRQDISFTMKNDKEVTLNKGQFLIEALSFWGFKIWFDQGENLSISARNLRKLDLEKEHELFAAQGYLRELAAKAREENPELTGEPVTLYDLSLQRMKG